MASVFSKNVQRHRVRLIDPILRPISTFCSWWTAELLATLPEGTREAIASTNKRVVVTTVDSEWIVTEGSEANRKTIAHVPVDSAELSAVLPQRINELVLCLPANKVLQRTMTLPLAAEENLREVLGFEMDRQTPFAADQVYYDFRISARHAATNLMTLELVVSPKKDVDEILESMTQLDVVPDTISTLNDDAEVLPINLIPGAMRSARRFTSPRLNSVLAAVGIVLLIVTLALPPVLHQNELAQLEQEISLAQNLGQDGLELQREVERITRTSEFLTQKKLSSVMVLQILDEVSRILPDNTWLIRFDINGSEIQLQGQSTAASELIRLLESSPLLKDAQFRSSVVQVPRTNKERFHLSVQLESAETT